MKYLLLILSFILTMSLSAVELPAEVQKSVKKYCKGQVIQTSLKSFKGNPVYLVDTRFGSNIISYFFSPKGRLIHSRKNTAVPNKTKPQNKDRFDGFENEKKLTDKERRRLEEEEDGEEDEDDEDEAEERDKHEDDEDEDHDEDEHDEDEDRDEDEHDEDEDRDEDEHDEDEDRDEHEDDEDETFRELNPRKLPKDFLKKIRKHIGNQTFEIGRETIYIVETNENGKNVTYIFTPKGNLLEREVHDEEDEDDEEDEE